MVESCKKPGVLAHKAAGNQSEAIVLICQCCSG